MAQSGGHDVPPFAGLLHDFQTPIQDLKYSFPVGVVHMGHHVQTLDCRKVGVLDNLVLIAKAADGLDGKVRFDQGRDTRGPLNVGMALTRTHEGREQRVAVIADGDFVSNTFIGNGGNLDLGMNLISWVGGDDVYLNLPAHTAGDVQLDLSHTAQTLIALGFLVLLPLGLMGAGLSVWWRRRRR